MKLLLRSFHSNDPIRVPSIDLTERNIYLTFHSWKHFLIHRTKPKWRSARKSHLVMLNWHITSIVHKADSRCCSVCLQWRCGIYGRVHVLHDQPWDRKCWFQSGSHQCFQGAHRRRQTSLCHWGWTLPGNSEKWRYRILNAVLFRLHS